MLRHICGQVDRYFSVKPVIVRLLSPLPNLLHVCVYKVLLMKISYGSSLCKFHGMILLLLIINVYIDYTILIIAK